MTPAQQLLLPLLCLIAGCTCVTRCGLGDPSATVSRELDERMELAPANQSDSDGTTWPSDVHLEDGLSEWDAVQFALWNNAQYVAMLTELGISHAQLIEAGLLSDPEFILLFPVGSKQLEFTANQAIDALWLRPIRIRAAEQDLNAVAERMLDNGLTLIRDVRWAHADLLFAQEQFELANQIQQVRTEIAALTEKRLAAGDVSQLENTSSQIEVLRAKADRARWEQEVVIAESRLREFIGLASTGEKIVAVGESSSSSLPLPDPKELVEEAFAMRPDLRATEVMIESASSRTDLARHQFISFDGVFDVNERGDNGSETGPGLRMTLPIFNGNQGQIAIAEARLQQTVRQHEALQQRVAQQVRTAHAQVEQASKHVQIVRDEMLPALNEALDLAQRSYVDGGVSYFLVLETTSQFFDARAREIEWEAARQRAFAELERSVGHRLVGHR